MSSFRLLLGTLNHLLVTDRIWTSRLEGISPRGTKLDEVLQKNFDGLAIARSGQDQRIVDFVFGLSEDRLAGPLDYATVFATTPCYLMLETNFVLLTNCATESAYFQYVK